MRCKHARMMRLEDSVISLRYFRQLCHCHIVTDGRSVSQSVSQYVLVSSPLWNLRLDIIFCLKVAVLSPWGALSDERSGLEQQSDPPPPS
jgi:hypothetical protein